MFLKKIYTDRRAVLNKKVKKGLVLLMGNELSPMNYPDNTYHFRQDSNFLYYIGVDLPGLTAIIDLDKKQTILFGRELTMDDIIWTGPQPSLTELAAKAGIKKVLPPSKIAGLIKKAKKSGRAIHFLPPYRPENKIKLSEWLGVPIRGLSCISCIPLVQAIIDQALIKGKEEIKEMEKALAITADMHLTAMRTAKAGMTEAEVTGKVHGVAISAGGNLAYPIILTVNGQTLHNHYHGNVMKRGQLLLGDFGAETAMHYAGDITRTFPISKKFTKKQKDIYELVLEMEESSIAACKPGVLYKDVHLNAARILVNGMRDLGLMKGDTEEAVAAGAHALFFPHGLGHAIGLDVHDMEDLGEDLVGYTDEVKRNPQFGIRSLRFGRALEKGHVMTVEPGIYFIPELIAQWESKGKFKNFINYSKLEKYLDFGGIRIEDNVLIMGRGQKVLGPRIPKTVAEIEAIRGGV